MLLRLSSTIYLSNWSPRNASQVELHDVFIELISTKCISGWAPRCIYRIDLHEMLLRLSSTMYLSNWAPRKAPQVDCTRYSSSWAARDAAEVSCSWRRLEICIWPYVVIGLASLPWGVPLRLLNFSYPVDLCFMYCDITQPYPSSLTEVRWTVQIFH
jgi:hypothetical protein